MTSEALTILISVVEDLRGQLLFRTTTLIQANTGPKHWMLTHQIWMPPEGPTSMITATVLVHQSLTASIRWEEYEEEREAEEDMIDEIPDETPVEGAEGEGGAGVIVVVVVAVGSTVMKTKYDDPRKILTTSRYLVPFLPLPSL
jgi:hypothetical protein